MTKNKNPVSRKIIRSWFERAVNENGLYDEIFYRFICLWVSFNAFYVAEFYKELIENLNGREPTDTNYLNFFCEKDEYKSKYNELLQTDSFFQMAIDKLYNSISGDNHITHEKGRVLDMRPSRQSSRKSKEFTDKNDIGQFILVGYQIRCNLFHGNKSPLNDNDEQLVGQMLQALKIFLKKIYEFEGYLS